jgi:toxin ParE1/3/4
MNVRYSRRARTDLSEILLELEAQSPAGALNVAAAIKRTIGTISRYPLFGRYIGIRQTLMRPVVGYPYLIFWRTVSWEVRIVHIRHGARKPWSG